MHVVIAAVAAALVVLILILVIVRSERRMNRRILGFTASDFHDLSTVTQNSQAKRDLDRLYTKAKRSMARVSASRGNKFMTFVVIGHRIIGSYGADADRLLVNPFIRRLTEEGFTVKYLPSGSMQMDKSSRTEPAFEISWNTVQEPDDEEPV